MCVGIYVQWIPVFYHAWPSAWIGLLPVLTWIWVWSLLWGNGIRFSSICFLVILLLQSCFASRKARSHLPLLLAAPAVSLLHTCSSRLRRGTAQPSKGCPAARQGGASSNPGCSWAGCKESGTLRICCCWMNIPSVLKAVFVFYLISC